MIIGVGADLSDIRRIQASIDGIPAFECQYGTHNTKYAIKVDRTLLHRSDPI